MNLVFGSGERVGFGYVHDGCGECEFCVKGNHLHCVRPEKVRAYQVSDFDQGSFASHAVVSYLGHYPLHFRLAGWNGSLEDE